MSFDQFEIQASNIYLEFERRIWADIDPSSLNDYALKQKQLQELQSNINQMYNQVQIERKNQKQTLKDLRTFLTMNQGEDGGMEYMTEQSGLDQLYYQQNEFQQMNNEYYNANIQHNAGEDS